MAGARLLVDDERAQRLSRALLRVTALAAIVVATLAGGYFALVSFRQDRALSVGTIRLSVSPGHKGALDVYVPLVDWGARFEAIRLPARLRVDLRTIDRNTVKKVATGHRIDVDRVRKEARDGIATYLRNLILTVLLCGGSLGVLTAFAVRGGATPKLRYTVGTAIGTALVMAAALVIFLPPRGQIDAPQYYAFGPDIPRALSAVEAAQRGSRGARPGAQRPARRPRAPRHRPRQPPRARGPPALHARIRPPQQHRRDPDPGKNRRQGPRLLPRRPDRPRQPGRGLRRQPRHPHRQPVRVRPRQPRLRPAREPARPRRRDRPHPHRPARRPRQDVRRADREDQGDPGGGLRRPVRAQRRRRASRTSSRSPTKRRSSASRPGCAHSATTSTS